MCVILSPEKCYNSNPANGLAGGAFMIRKNNLGNLRRVYVKTLDVKVMQHSVLRRFAASQINNQIKKTLVFDFLFKNDANKKIKTYVFKISCLADIQVFYVCNSTDHMKIDHMQIFTLVPSMGMVAACAYIRPSVHAAQITSSFTSCSSCKRTQKRIVLQTPSNKNGIFLSSSRSPSPSSFSLQTLRVLCLERLAGKEGQYTLRKTEKNRLFSSVQLKNIPESGWQNFKGKQWDQRMIFFRLNITTFYPSCVSSLPLS